MEIYNETLMYTVAVMAAWTYPSQCLPDELLQAKVKVKIPSKTTPQVDRFSEFSGSEFIGMQTTGS